MARAGIYKSDVKMARDSLLAQGKHPSIDAIRMAMGNTGSKTTIHRYVRELEQEAGEGGDGQPMIDEAILMLVRQLASSLHAAADERITAVHDSYEARVEALNTDNQQWRQDNDNLQLALAAESQARQQLASRNEQQGEQLQAERILVAQLEQQLLDMQVRLEENEKHRQSLEDKHQHARQALEHYRESVRTRREQELQKHDQQMQQWQAELRRCQLELAQKQQELTHLHQELARQGAQQLEARQNIHALEGRHRDKERQYEILRDENAELKARIAILQTAEQQGRQQQQAWQLLGDQLQALQQQLAATSAATRPAHDAEARQVPESGDYPSEPDSASVAANPPEANR